MWAAAVGEARGAEAGVRFKPCTRAFSRGRRCRRSSAGAADRRAGDRAGRRGDAHQRVEVSWASPSRPARSATRPSSASGPWSSSRCRRRRGGSPRRRCPRRKHVERAGERADAVRRRGRVDEPDHRAGDVEGRRRRRAALRGGRAFAVVADGVVEAHVAGHTGRRIDRKAPVVAVATTVPTPAIVVVIVPATARRR